MTSGASMATETVDELIARVEAAHPRLGPTAMAAYFEAVHQELAPLARALERRVTALQAELLECQRIRWNDRKALRRVAGDHKGHTVSVFTCPKCGNEYWGGTSPVTVYAENGRACCRACNPGCLPSLATAMTERLEPRCQTNPSAPSA